MEKDLTSPHVPWRFKFRAFIFRIYAYLKWYMPIWRLVNKKAITLFKNDLPKLSAVQTRVLDDVRKEGVAVTSLSELFPEQTDLLPKLQAFIEKKAERANTNHKKGFLVDYLPEVHDLDFTNPFLDLSISPTILDVVNSYIGMYSVMHYFHIQKTLVADPRNPGFRYSQAWHRDPQEQIQCKVFIYLNDVDENTGPFIYVRGSSRGHKYWRLFPQEPPAGAYPLLEEVESRVPKEDRMPLVGKAGTVVFCDTSGLHRGGYSFEKERKMSTFGYEAKSYRENMLYSFSPKLLAEVEEKYPPQSSFALNKKWMRKAH